MPADITALQDIITQMVEDRSDDLDRLIRLRSQYYNLVDDDRLPTESKISFAFAFATVEENIFPAMEYLFPQTNSIRLLPEEPVDAEEIRNAEWAMHQMVTRRIPVQKASAFAIVDSFKVGIGYTITEPITVTPWTSDVMVRSNGKANSQQRVMVKGKERRSINERHLNVGQVLGYKDGSDTNGDKRSSTIALLELYQESQVRRMAENMGDRNTSTVFEAYGKFKEDKDRTDVHQCISSWLGKIADLGGPEYIDNGGNENLPTLIPVVKVYQEDREVWLAYGDVVVFEMESQYQTMRCPITRWTAVIDGDEWYPYSIAEAMEQPHLATNIWVNLIYDMMTWATNRPMLYDKGVFPNGAPEYGMREQYGIEMDRPGREKAVSFLDAPSIGADSFAVGDRIDAYSDRVKGRKDLAGRNYTRGGAHAFQELVSSISGRERIAARILEMGGLNEVYTNILIEMQMIGEDFVFHYRENNADGQDTVNTRTITASDINHSYTVTLSLKDKYLTGSMDVNERAALYDRMKDDDYFDPVEVRRTFVGNDDLAMRLMKPRTQADLITRQNRNADLIGRVASGRQGLNRTAQQLTAPQPGAGA